MTLLDNPRATTTDDTGWAGFTAGPWQHGNDVRDLIQRNYTPFTDDASFLTGATDRTLALWARLTDMFPRQRALGVYDVDPTTPASITAHAPGYIDQPSETIVGLQTDAPLTRAIMPFGGRRTPGSRYCPSIRWASTSGIAWPFRIRCPASCRPIPQCRSGYGPSSGPAASRRSS